MIFSCLNIRFPAQNVWKQVLKYQHLHMYTANDLCIHRTLLTYVFIDHNIYDTGTFFLSPWICIPLLHDLALCISVLQIYFWAAKRIWFLGSEQNFIFLECPFMNKEIQAIDHSCRLSHKFLRNIFNVCFRNFYAWYLHMKSLKTRVHPFEFILKFCTSYTYIFP